MQQYNCAHQNGIGGPPTNYLRRSPKGGGAHKLTSVARSAKGSTWK